MDSELQMKNSSTDHGDQGLPDENQILTHQEQDLQNHASTGETREIFQDDGKSERVPAEHFSTPEAITENAAFNPQKAFDEQANTISPARRNARKVKRAFSAVAHPKDFAKRKAAKRLAVGEHLYLSQQTDQSLIKRYEELKEAETKGEGNMEPDISVATLRGDIDELEGHREALNVGWTTTRFINRARVVQPGQFPKPRIEDYRTKTSDGKTTTDWLPYIGHRMLHGSSDFTAQYIDDMEKTTSRFDRGILIDHTERLIMASEPWQSYYAHLRNLARWRDPKLTGKWFSLWLFVWYNNRVLSFVWAYIVFITIKRKLYSADREDLQESHARAAKKGETVYQFSEMLKKHGRGDWVNPTIDKIGPFIQLQLSDLADWIEMLNNFSEWKNPWKTAETLFFFFCCTILGLFASTDFVMRIITLFAILLFFLGRPVASRYPRYRHLVSPFMWIFWDVPTNAQVSFQYLRRNAQLIKETAGKRQAKEIAVDENGLTTGAEIGHPVNDAALEHDQGASASPVSTGSTGYYNCISPKDLHDMNDSDLISFHCYWKGLEGRLILSTSSMRFTRGSPSNTVWQHPFVQLIELRKVKCNGLIIGSTEGLDIEFTDGLTYRLESMKNRDEVVNTILGFSDLQWQILQPKPEDAVGTKKPSEDLKEKAKKMMGKLRVE